MDLGRLGGGLDKGFYGNTKVIDKIKKHRRELKSGDHAKHWNFKFMNINWGNQFNINDPSHFIQNQQLGSNISQSNMMLFQQQLKMGMLNNQNHQNDIQSLLNPSINLSQINNQALLLYDKHTNSIIPINSGFGQNIGNTQFNGSAVFTPMHLSGISTIENPSAVKPKNGLQKQFDLDTSKPEGVKWSIPHYFKGGNITLNQTNLQEKPTNSKIIRQISKEDKSIPLSLDAELSENQTAWFNKQSSEESKSDLEILTKSGSLGIISKCTIEKGPAVDSLNNRLQTGIRAIEISKLKASDFELNNRESEQFTIEAKHIPKTTWNELQRNVENNKPDSQLSNQSNEKDENNEIEEDNKTKDNLIWISFDDNGTQQWSNKKKIIEKRMNWRNKQAKTKESNHKSNISALTSNSKSRKDIQNYNNFDDVNNTTKASAGTKNNIQESESKTSSVAQTPIHTATKSRGLKAERRNTPIMVDLFDSEANSINSKNNGLLLESGDNPICSFSSKRGVVGLKAFHPGETGKPKPEEIINLPSNEHTANSSLAEMFMSKNKM